MAEICIGSRAASSNWNIVNSGNEYGFKSISGTVAGGSESTFHSGDESAWNSGSTAVIWGTVFPILVEIRDGVWKQYRL